MKKSNRVLYALDVIAAVVVSWLILYNAPRTTMDLPVETAVPVAVVTPACAACVACAAPTESVVTPAPAEVLPTPLPSDLPVSVGTVDWTDEEIVQVLWENERVRRDTKEEGVELRFDPQPELPWWTRLADDRKIITALYATDPQDHGQVVVVLEEKSAIAWIIKRADPGRYQVFSWQLWNVPGEILDLNVLPDSSDDELGLFIVYTVKGVEWPIQREITIIFPLG